ncbi:MAG TPA: hypothetical protein IAB70_00165 [Candidatus Merdicola faecigallinarum]|uniref:Uncharacterized protein n=1 Tax=Candidatus Merdicola faecigallinarum TaxID=2840862 RepID=A0A9D1S958_9FIRM|nr:hypothetical protein [Candidatus Merdicola faecigallinarum]
MKGKEIKQADENWEDILEIIGNAPTNWLDVERYEIDLCQITIKYNDEIVYVWEGSTEAVLKILEDIFNIEPSQKRRLRRVLRLREELEKEIEKI